MTIASGLERMIGKGRMDEVLNSRAYKWFADGVANNLFSLVYGLNEYFIAGMNMEEVGRARLAAAIGNMATGGIYGEWHEYLYKKLDVTEKSTKKKRYGVDVLAFATGQTPIYIGYLVAATAGWEALKSFGDAESMSAAFNNIDWDKIGSGATFLTLAAPLAATPQKKVYNFVRDQFGLNKIGEKVID